MAKANKTGGSLRNKLTGGDRRSTGAADAVARLIARAPERLQEALTCMRDEDPIVRMRAADAVEKASRTRSDLLAPFKPMLLGSLADDEQQEVRWHMLAILPRLDLTPAEKKRVWALAKASLAHPSRIVACEALSALHALSRGDARRTRHYEALADGVAETGSPSLRARVRRLAKLG